MGREWGSLRPRKKTKRLGIATCAGKEPFESFVLADRIASSRSRHGKRNHVYRCDGCQKFHLGSSLTKRFRRPRGGELEE